METAELAPGVRLGPYEIIARVGAGGMGEVFRARDTRLGRDVAIKVVNSAMAADEAVRKRFYREARAISALAHPNICALHDIGSANGIDYLVMEYLEGETLAERMKRGALPTDETIRIGIDIAAALELAHRRNVTHRDLKPANVMLTSSGAKLLDFGLARLTQTGDSSMLSREDSMIGTIEYMAPEQVKGEETDARTDIFALGVLLYEMIAGQRPFRGETPASVIGAILFSEPEPLPRAEGDSPALDRLISTCLEKKPEDRFQSVHDVRLQLRWLADGGVSPRPEARKGRLTSARAVRRIAITLLVITMAAAAAALLELPLFRTAERQVRFTIEAPLEGHDVEWPAVSPDGSKIAFELRTDRGEASIWIRELSSPAPKRLVDRAAFPVWSHDGDALAFFSGDKLQILRLGETNASAIATATAPRGLAWGSEGTLLYVPDIASGVWATDARGSTSRQVTRLDRSAGDVSHRWPEFLPDGEHFVFVIQSSRVQRAGLYAASTRTGVIRKISPLQSRAVIAASGWMFFVKDRRLWRQRFDLRDFELQGEPIAVADNIEPDLRTTGATRISVSRDGVLAFSSPIDRRNSIVWVDRSGQTLRTLAPVANYIDPALSPDGKVLAVSRVDEETGINSIRLVDTSTGAMTAFVDEESNAIAPTWSSDGRNIFYASDRRGPYDVYERAVGSVSADRLVFKASTYARPIATSKSGTLLENSSPAGATSDFLFWPAGATSPRLLFSIGAGGADLTEDGRWVALRGVENADTRAILEVRAAADPLRRLRLGPDEASQPTWRPDGGELYYADPSGQLIATPFRDGSFGSSTPLFPVSLYVGFTSRSFVPARDGRRFLVLQPVTAPTHTKATVVLHWDAK